MKGINKGNTTIQEPIHLELEKIEENNPFEHHDS
jgi:hypothetical protein